MHCCIDGPSKLVSPVVLTSSDLYPRNSKWPVTTLVLPAVLPSQARIRLALLVERYTLRSACLVYDVWLTAIDLPRLSS